MDMKVIDSIATILVFVGAINWGLVGLANTNLIAALFGTSVVATVVYVLVALSGLLVLYSRFMKK